MRIPKHLATVMAVTVAAGSMSFNVANAETKATAENIVGKDRYETAVKISKAGWSSADTAILVNDSAIADALSATPFANAKNAPVLLTGKKGLHELTKQELKRLGVKNVYMIGGTTVLPSAIEKELKKMGIKTERISGKNRETTAVEIAEELDKIVDVKEIAVVNGTTGLADAVSVAGAAAERDMPIILSNPKKGTAVSDKFIKDNGINKSYIIGGTKVVPNSVSSKLPGAKRIEGSNRNETNAKVMDTFYTEKYLNNAYVAKDGKNKESNLIDALAVGALAARNGSPVVLADSKKLSNGQKHVLNTKSLSKVTQVGGKGNEKVFKELKDMQEVKTYEVTTAEELNNAIAKADANDIINVNSDNISNITISTDKALRINLYGTYTGTVRIASSSNIIVTNKGTISELIIAGSEDAIVVNDDNAKINKVEITASSENIKIENNGTLTNIENDAEGTEIDNNGTISNPVTGTETPNIDGNKPSTGGSSSGSGGSSSGGGTIIYDKVPADAAAMENFNTHKGTDYKGVNVGWKLKDGLDFGDIAKIEVKLYSGNELLVTNTAKLSKHAELYKKGTKQFSTPFAFDKMTDDYWTFGDWKEDLNKKPTKAELIITGKASNNVIKFENNKLSSVAGQEWFDLFNASKVDSREKLNEAIKSDSNVIILAKNGNFSGTINIDKPGKTIIGEDREATKITGQINVSAENVSLQNVTILRGNKAARAAEENYGIMVAQDAVCNGLKIANCTFGSKDNSNLKIGIGTYSNIDKANNENDAKNISIKNCNFINCETKGIYLEKGVEVEIENNVFDGCGENSGNDQSASKKTASGIDINLKAGTYATEDENGYKFGSIKIYNNTFKDCGLNTTDGAAVLIKARGTGLDTGYSKNKAFLYSADLRENTFKNNRMDVIFGEKDKHLLPPVESNVSGPEPEDIGPDPKKVEDYCYGAMIGEQAYKSINEAINAAQEGNTIDVYGVHRLTEQVVIDKDNLTIQGYRVKTLDGKDDIYNIPELFVKGDWDVSNPEKNLISIKNVEKCTLQNLNIRESKRNGISVWNSGHKKDCNVTKVSECKCNDIGVLLKNMSVDASGSGIVVNGSRVKVEEVTINGKWQGADVSQGVDVTLPCILETDSMLCFGITTDEEVSRRIASDTYKNKPYAIAILLNGVNVTESNLIRYEGDKAVWGDSIDKY